MTQRTIIAGAGQAGLQVALSLRQGGYDGDILLLGAEAHIPYQRPPLSKQVLKQEWPPEKCHLRSQEVLDQNNITFSARAIVTRLFADRDCVRLDSGEEVEFDHLAICTGAQLNRIHLSGSALNGVHYLRTLDDAIELSESLQKKPRVVVAGGGYIGLEVAASARSLGCEVSVIESLPHVLQRSALPPVADFILQRHQNEGVKFYLGRMMTEIHGGDHQVKAISLDDGQFIEAELVLKGIGVRPEIDWLEDSGIEVGRGVRVDEACRTNRQNIFAAGDVAELKHPFYADHMVLESVQNAVSQGKIIAQNILGGASVYSDVPWFWSEQYDMRFQMAGIPQPSDKLVIRNTDPTSISVLSVGPDRLNAIQCINEPRDYMAARKLIGMQETVDCEALANPDTNLKELF